MTRPTDPRLLDDEATDDGATDAEADVLPTANSVRPTAPDLSALPIAGLTRRRMAIAMGVLLAVWLVLMFARQVGDAAAASSQVDGLVISNAQQAAHLSALNRELQQIQRQRYIDQEARAYGLGKTHELAFTLDPNASPLPADAPGSASVRLGSDVAGGSPLERWLTLLFGAGD